MKILLIVLSLISTNIFAAVFNEVHKSGINICISHEQINLGKHNFKGVINITRLGLDEYVIGFGYINGVNFLNKPEGDAFIVLDSEIAVLSIQDTILTYNKDIEGYTVEVIYLINRKQIKAITTDSLIKINTDTEGFVYRFTSQVVTLIKEHDLVCEITGPIT